MKENKENKRRVKFILSCVLCLISCVSLSQPTEKLKIDDELWLESAVEYYLQDSSYFYASASFQRGDSRFGSINNSPFGGRDLLIGYEKFIRVKWQVGASINREFVVKGRRTDFFTGYLKHNGRISSLIFLKELGVSFLQEREFPIYNNGNNTFFNLSAYLGKRYEIGKLKIQTGLSYKAVFWYEHSGEPRTVDQTFLRFQQDLKVHENVIISLFASRNTDYFHALEASARFDSHGNEIAPPQPFRKLNLRTAVYGFRVRLLLNKQNASGELPFVLK
ncbi:MAG: hypothetical protein ACI85I_000183 [Arenicella sp.]|jgi:hypothetical protein